MQRADLPRGTVMRGCGGRALAPCEVGCREKMRKGKSVIKAGEEGGRETAKHKPVSSLHFHISYLRGFCVGLEVAGT